MSFLWEEGQGPEVSTLPQTPLPTHLNDRKAGYGLTFRLKSVKGLGEGV
jgi:hypothetical protein